MEMKRCPSDSLTAGGAICHFFLHHKLICKRRGNCRWKTRKKRQMERSPYLTTRFLGAKINHMIRREEWWAPNQYSFLTSSASETDRRCREGEWQCSDWRRKPTSLSLGQVSSLGSAITHLQIYPSNPKWEGNSKSLSFIPNLFSFSLTAGGLIFSFML